MRALKDFLEKLPAECLIDSNEHLTDDKLLQDWTIFEIGETGSNGLNASELSIPAPFLTRSVLEFAHRVRMMQSKSWFEWRVRAMEAAEMICRVANLPYEPQTAEVEIRAPDFKTELELRALWKA